MKKSIEKFKINAIDGTIDKYANNSTIIALGIKNNYITAFKASKSNLQTFYELDVETIVDDVGHVYELHNSEANLVASFGDPITLAEATKYFPQLNEKSYWRRLNIKGYGDVSNFEYPEFD